MKYGATLDTRFFSVKIGDEEHDIDVDRLLRIPHGAEVEMSRKSGADLAWYGSLYAQAKTQLEIAKRYITIWEALAIDTLLERAGKQKKTLPKWKAEIMVRKSQKYLEVTEKVVVAQEAVNKLAALYDGLWQNARILEQMVRNPGSRMEGNATQGGGDAGDGWD